MTMEKILDGTFQKDGSYPGIAASIVDSKGNRLYHKAFGVNDITAESPVAYTTSTQTMIFSCTKLLTTIAALQLVEQGKLGLDEHVSKYVPEIDELEVMDGTTEDGKVRTRPAHSKALVRHLFTHTIGLAYDFFDQQSSQWCVENERTPGSYMIPGTRSAFVQPSVSDPGTKYAYGISIDYLGFVLEKVTGQPLFDYIRQNITEPLGMKSTDRLTKEGEPSLLVHSHGISGADPIAPIPGFEPPRDAEVYGGGHGLVSTLDDYTSLLSTLLNKGVSPTTGASILKPENIEQYLFRDHIPSEVDRSGLGNMTTASAFSSNAGTLFSGKKLGWSCSFMLNLEDIPGGRKANSGGWAGLSNSYYWVDPVGDRAGIVMTNILPFMDADVLAKFETLERAAYGADSAQKSEWYSVQK
jgi:methyl acetate hydrolase